MIPVLAEAVRSIKNAAELTHNIRVLQATDINAPLHQADFVSWGIYKACSTHMILRVMYMRWKLLTDVSACKLNILHNS